MRTPTIQLGKADLTRVGYVDVAIPSEVVGLGADDLVRVPWRSPLWAEGDRVRVGAAAWFADVDGERIAFDPVQAADDVLRGNPSVEAHHQAAIAQTFADAGFPRESVDLLVLSHIEGVGMVAWRNEDGSWSPFFPNARVLISDVALEGFVASDAGAEATMERAAWRALIEQGHVGTYAHGEKIVGGLVAEVTHGHCPGHATMNFRDTGGATRATMLGHLAISPLHLATGECRALHADPAAAWSRLHDAARDGRLLIGPLWPAPGYGRWQDGALVPGR